MVTEIMTSVVLSPEIYFNKESFLFVLFRTSVSNQCHTWHYQIRHACASSSVGSSTSFTEWQKDIIF